MPTSDSTNPGLVEVANQAYPAVLNSGIVAEVPKDFNPDAFQGSGYAALPPPGAGADSLPFPTPVEVPVANQALQMAHVVGVPFQFPLNSNIGQQNLVDGRALAEFIVTEAGSFQTNAPEFDSDIKTFLITAVKDADVRPLINPTVSTNRLMIFLSPADLTSFGLTMAGREVEFIDGPADGFTREIVDFQANFIIINVNDPLDTIPFASFPVTGNHFTIDVKRDGSEPTFSLGNAPIEVNVFANTPLENPPVFAAPTAPNQGNFFAGDGVIVPFVGTGLRVPPLLGTFEIAPQNLTRGLPANLPAGPSSNSIRNVDVANQSIPNGLPTNVIIS